MSGLTPRQIVNELDRYIVGQAAAKRAMAIALRNRYRRQQLPPELRAEIVPKNILLIGPTGVGKTEVARRLARLVNAPFVKVEATKYTEVGYVGRDVESMVRDLVEASLRLVKAERIEAVKDQAERAAEERILSLLVPGSQPERRGNPLEALFGMGQPAEAPPDEESAARRQSEAARRQEILARLRAGELEDTVVELEIEETPTMPMLDAFQGPGLEEMGQSFQEMLGSILPKRRRKKKVTVAVARKLLVQEEAQKLIDMDQATSEAIRRAENDGIIFIDEFDKIAGKERGHGPEVSREGVQRDILPIVEGSTVQTKYGAVQTDHILFVAAGAFHVAKPSDLIPELQGRFPIRVEMTSLTEADLVRILTEPEHALTRQYAALLATEGVSVEFTDDGIAAIASVAARINAETEDIGARRLHTVMEKLLEDVSFLAPDIAPTTIGVNQAYVNEKLAGILGQHDVSRFIL